MAECRIAWTGEGTSGLGGRQWSGRIRSRPGNSPTLRVKTTSAPALTHPRSRVSENRGRQRIVMWIHRLRQGKEVEHRVARARSRPAAFSVPAFQARKS
eukprot:43653-Rhodomonas_salina.1